MKFNVTLSPFLMRGADKPMREMPLTLEGDDYDAVLDRIKIHLKGQPIHERGLHISILRTDR